MTDKKPEVLEDGALLGVQPPSLRNVKLDEATEAFQTGEIMALSVWEPDSAAEVDQTEVRRIERILAGEEEPQPSSPVEERAAAAPNHAVSWMLDQMDAGLAPEVAAEPVTGVRPVPDPGINSLLDSME